MPTIGRVGRRPADGIAPLATLRPSSGEVSSRVGAATWAKGTVITISTGDSASLPVVGSAAVTTKRFSPRRRSTTVRHTPSPPARTRRSSRPGALTVTSPSARSCPGACTDVVSSATSVTAVGGSVTTRAAAREAQQLEPHVGDDRQGRPGDEGGDDDPGPTTNPRRGAVIGRGTTIAGSTGPRPARGSRRRGPRPGRGRGRSRSCAGTPGVDAAPEAPPMLRAPSPRGTGGGSSSHARAGRRSTPFASARRHEAVGHALHRRRGSRLRGRAPSRSCPVGQRSGVLAGHASSSSSSPFASRTPGSADVAPERPAARSSRRTLRCSRAPRAGR